MYKSQEKKRIKVTWIGPLIVHDPADPYAGQYDEELVLTTSDWYHDSTPVLIQQMLQTSNTQFLPPFPDSLLMNDSQNVTFQFTPGKTYKIDIISMAAFASDSRGSCAEIHCSSERTAHEQKKLCFLGIIR